MTLEQVYYEYKPYALAFIGIAASSKLSSGIGSASGTLLMSAAAFIGYARYYARCIQGVKPQFRSINRKGRITRPNSKFSSSYRRLQ